MRSQGPPLIGIFTPMVINAINPHMNANNKSYADERVVPESVEHFQSRMQEQVDSRKLNDWENDMATEDLDAALDKTFESLPPLFDDGFKAQMHEQLLEKTPEALMKVFAAVYTVAFLLWVRNPLSPNANEEVTEWQQAARTALPGAV